MTRVDESGPSVWVGPGERAELSRFFRSEAGVVAAYLFGSQARGAPGPLSDVDLAVWLDPHLAPTARHTRQLELMGAANELLRTSEVQVVILNDAPPLLAQRVLAARTLLADNEPGLRVKLEVKAIERYLDTAWLREELGRGVRMRLAEGTYGRQRRD